MKCMWGWLHLAAWTERVFYNGLWIWVNVLILCWTIMEGKSTPIRMFHGCFLYVGTKILKNDLGIFNDDEPIQPTKSFQSLAYSPTYLVTHSPPTHSLIHSLTHSLTHSQTHWRILSLSCLSADHLYEEFNTILARAGSPEESKGMLSRIAGSLFGKNRKWSRVKLQKSKVKSHTSHIDFISSAAGHFLHSWCYLLSSFDWYISLLHIIGSIMSQ